MTALVYLAAIVAANLAVVAFGPGITILDAFLLIGLDLTLRDRLHDEWKGRWLRPKMVALIAAGGVLSYLVNASAAQIALSSTVAFVVAAALDATVYGLLEGRPRWERVNGSNIVGAAADSLLFPTLAFGSFLPLIVLGQFLAKVLGGFLWFWVLRALPVRRRTA